MIIFCDTETTGLPDFNQRARWPGQPHIVQIAALICDEAGNILETYEAIAKPDGWAIPPELTAIHGISNEHALKVGIPEKEILVKVLAMIRASNLLCAYNVTFDKFIVRIGLRRYDLMTDDDDQWWKSLPTYCAMRAMIDVVNKEPKIRGRYCYPKLMESYRHAFGKGFEGAHGAMADLQATLELFRWQRAQGLHGEKQS